MFLSMFLFLYHSPARNIEESSLTRKSSSNNYVSISPRNLLPQSPQKALSITDSSIPCSEDL